MAKRMEGTEEYEEMRHVLTVLHRRVSVWRRIVETGSDDENQLEPIDWEQVARSIEQMQSLTADAENGSAWDSFP